jgi:hypothetical protein
MPNVNREITIQAWVSFDGHAETVDAELEKLIKRWVAKKGWDLENLDVKVVDRYVISEG